MARLRIAPIFCARPETRLLGLLVFASCIAISSACANCGKSDAKVTASSELRAAADEEARAHRTASDALWDLAPQGADFGVVLRPGSLSTLHHSGKEILKVVEA